MLMKCIEYYINSNDGCFFSSQIWVYFNVQEFVLIDFISFPFFKYVLFFCAQIHRASHPFCSLHLIFFFIIFDTLKFCNPLFWLLSYPFFNSNDNEWFVFVGDYGCVHSVGKAKKKEKETRLLWMNMVRKSRYLCVNRKKNCCTFCLCSFDKNE